MMDTFVREDTWKDRPVLVTGASGFIGSWLGYALLKKGARVVALDIKPALPALGGQWEDYRSGAHYISGDVREATLITRILSEYHIRTVFHLAAEAIVGRAYENPVEALDTNVRGTWTVLDACRSIRPDAEIVIASSDKAYGAHDELPYQEDYALLGDHPYDCSKSVADRIAAMYAKSYGLRLAITRCGNVYGPGDLHFSRLIPETIQSFFLGRAPEIRSDGMYRRDYVHVADIVVAYLATAEGLMSKDISGHAFNFGTATPRTALEVVRKISACMDAGHIEPRILGMARYEIKDQYLDSQKARAFLSWEPLVDFDTGITDTVGWYREYLSHGQVV